MSRKIVVSLCAALSVFVFGTMTAGQASGANMKIVNNEGFLAIYGNPPATGPVGWGLGRNFGFGQNLLLKAGGAYPGTLPLSITFEGGLKSKACDSYIGGTLMSNKTGVNNPLSLAIQFVDFECNTNNIGQRPQSYADTFDRSWITEICSPGAAAEACKTDPLIKKGGKGEVKIEDVSFNLGPGVVVQGTAWGTWENGAAKVPPCITLKNPPEEAGANQTLIVTQTIAGAPAVGAKAEKVEGRACLFSANNDWVTQSEKTEPQIEIANE